MTELKPCPFCGGKAVLANSNVNVRFDCAEYSGTIICMGCGVTMTAKWYTSYDNEIQFVNNHTVTELWNRRANNDKL